MKKAKRYILFSKAVCVETKQNAWDDTSLYRCPFIGEVPREEHLDAEFAIARAISKKFSRPGWQAGSSYGARSTRLVAIDWVAKQITYTISVGIGE